jgi:hypothetical protein
LFEDRFNAGDIDGLMELYEPNAALKLVRRAGPETIGQLNAALVAKLAQGKLLRARKLRMDTTVVRLTSTIRPMPTCWRVRSASWVGWYGASRVVARPARPSSAIVAGRPVGG